MKQIIQWLIFASFTFLSLRNRMAIQAFEQQMEYNKWPHHGSFATSIATNIYLIETRWMNACISHFCVTQSKWVRLEFILEMFFLFSSLIFVWFVELKHAINNFSQGYTQDPFSIGPHLNENNHHTNHHIWTIYSSGPQTPGHGPVLVPGSSSIRPQWRNS